MTPQERQWYAEARWLTAQPRRVQVLYLRAVAGRVAPPSASPEGFSPSPPPPDAPPARHVHPGGQL